MNFNLDFDAEDSIRSRYIHAIAQNVPSSDNQVDSDYETIKRSIHQIEDDISDPNNLNLMDHSYYYLLIGKVKGFNIYNYQISDPNCECTFSTYKWPIDPKYLNFVSDRSLNNYYNYRGNLLTFIEVLSNLQDYESINAMIQDPDMKEPFLYKGLAEEEIQKMILAIRSYTGDISWANNRILSHDIKSAFLNGAVPQMFCSDITLLNSYFLKALHYLPIYFGICSRCVSLKPEEIGDYVPGIIVTWLQFSSSTVGETPLESFINRNVVFIIYSVSGRNISRISKISNEREVVFLPFSQFLVIKIEYRSNKSYIFLRQIELGISKKNVLWIDENIFNPGVTIKQFIEYASYVNPRIRFILKTSCQTALEYLKSHWGMKKLENLKNFRIILNSYFNSGADAGVKFCLDALELGYNCEIMIYSHNMAEVWQYLNYYQLATYKIAVVSQSKEVCKFICFD